MKLSEIIQQDVKLTNMLNNKRDEFLDYCNSMEDCYDCKYGANLDDECYVEFVKDNDEELN